MTKGGRIVRPPPADRGDRKGGKRTLQSPVTRKNNSTYGRAPVKLFFGGPGRNGTLPSPPIQTTATKPRFYLVEQGLERPTCTKGHSTARTVGDAALEHTSIHEDQDRPALPRRPIRPLGGPQELRDRWPPLLLGSGQLERPTRAHGSPVPIQTT